MACMVDTKKVLADREALAERRLSLRAFLSATFIVFLTLAAFAQRPEHDGKIVLFGNLHAHSGLSGDFRKQGAPNRLPLNAFQYAQQKGLDFLAITDHHKATDSPGPSNLRISPADYSDKLFKAAADYNTQQAGKFIAIAGIEWGNTATGNHVNIFGSQTLPPDTIKDANYDALYAWAAQNAEFLQFNHPNSWGGSNNRNLAVGNYGQALFPDAAAFVAAIDRVKTISIISSVSGGHITGKYKDSESKTHRRMQWEGFYRQYLNMGLHISPAANQDTHWKNWGTVTAARTAVWADGVTSADLMSGFKANRVYTTEDDEMAVVFQVRFGGQTYWMGDQIPLPEGESEVELLVKVWQGPGSDNDPTEEGPYTVTVVNDRDGVGGQQAAEEPPIADIPSGQMRTIPVVVSPGQYIYISVTEQSGKDNPVGDGEDVQNNQTGQPGADGARDDMNDAAWTSPVWFVKADQPPVAAEFIWSVNSNLYHDPDCWAVKTIGAANKRSGPAPAGKTKHACHPTQ